MKLQRLIPLALTLPVLLAGCIVDVHPTGTGDWMQFVLFTTIAYLLSRGIAKASRVYEI